MDKRIYLEGEYIKVETHDGSILNFPQSSSVYDEEVDHYSLENKYTRQENYIIGFLTATCMFLFMGNTENKSDGHFEKIYAEQIICKSMLVENEVDKEKVYIQPDVIKIFGPEKGGPYNWISTVLNLLIVMSSGTIQQIDGYGAIFQ